MGGGIGQDPATEVTHLGLNQPPVFSSDIWLSAAVRQIMSKDCRIHAPYFYHSVVYKSKALRVYLVVLPLYPWPSL